MQTSNINNNINNKYIISNPASKQTPKPNSFHNFDQRSYDYDDLQARLLDKNRPKGEKSQWKRLTIIGKENKRIELERALNQLLQICTWWLPTNIITCLR